MKIIYLDAIELSELETLTGQEVVVTERAQILKKNTNDRQVDFVAVFGECVTSDTAGFDFYANGDTAQDAILNLCDKMLGKTLYYPSETGHIRYREKNYTEIKLGKVTCTLSFTDTIK